MAPRRKIDSRSADSTSQSSITRGCLPHAVPGSSHPIAKKQPIVRIVQIRPPKLIKTDLANFRDIVHLFTGQQLAGAQEQEEGTTSTESRKQQTDLIASISNNSSACNITYLATSPALCSSPSASSSSSSSSSSCSDASTSFHNNPATSKGSEIQELDIQEYGSLLSFWDGMTADDIVITSKLLSRDEGLMGASVRNSMDGMCNALESLIPYDHMAELNINHAEFQPLWLL